MSAGPQITPPLTVRPLGYVPALDGVRAVAVVTVLLSHAGLRWFPGGEIGVDMFFVLSGFLITGLLREELHTTGTLRIRAFYVRRFLRLTPALWVLLGLSLLGCVLFRRDLIGSMASEAMKAALYTRNVTSFGGTLPFDIFGHLWSLAVEEQFYLVWPLAIIVLSRRERWAIPILVAAALALSLAGIRGSGLVLGALLAFLRGNGVSATSLSISRRTWAVLAWVSAGCFVLEAVEAWGGDWMFPVGAGESAILIAAVAAGGSGGAVGAFLSARAMVHVGKRSYAMYLFHWPLFVAVDEWLVLPAPLSLPLKFVLTLATAELSWRLVERHFVRLRHRLPMAAPGAA